MMNFAPARMAGTGRTGGTLFDRPMPVRDGGR